MAATIVTTGATLQMEGGGENHPPRIVEVIVLSGQSLCAHWMRLFVHHASAPPVWYSVTRVSKKFFSLPKSMVSLIHGNGFLAP